MSDLAELRIVFDQWQNWAKDILAKKFNRKNLNYNFETKHVLALIGVRRSGKTFYTFETAEKFIQANNLAPSSFLYMNFEDPYFIKFNSTDELDNLITIYNERLLTKPKLIILDEIQNIDQWQRWVRKYVDLEEFKIIVTGSSAKLLSKEISSTLTGRSVGKTIYPLSFSEYLEIKARNNERLNPDLLNAHLQNYLLEGAFPELITIEDTYKRRELLREYLQDIIYKDIVNRYEIRSTHNLNLLVNYYLTNISSPHSSYSIKKALEIPTDTVSELTQYLEDAFLILNISRYHYNLKVQKRDSRKFYAIDTGLRNANCSSATNDLGKLFENVIFIELKRRYKDIYYYKEEQEVDFVITENYRIKALIQACYSDLKDKEVYTREVQALESAMQTTKLKEGLIITYNREENFKTEYGQIKLIPFYKWITLS